MMPQTVTTDAEKDEYTCHYGRKLKFRYAGRSKNSSGCPFKGKCTKSPGNRQLHVSKKFIRYIQQSYENITSETGTLLRLNRSIQVEGAFGILKSDYQYKRFLTRGKTNVKTEIPFLVMGYNINKLHSKIQGDRLKESLHPLKKTA